jgi:hypothetical protein
MSKFKLFIKSFSGLVALGVIFCGIADVYLSFTDEVNRNPHLFKTVGKYFKYFYYEFFAFIFPVSLYAFGQFIMKGSIWASILGILCIFITSSLMYNVYFVGGGPSMVMLIGVNVICYWLVGLITIFGSVFYINKTQNQSLKFDARKARASQLKR